MRELYIDTNPLETRIALVEDGRLAELWVDRAAEGRTVGNIYKGVVRKVLPGLEAAFVDIGTGRDGFLPFDETSPEAKGGDEAPAGGRKPVLKHGQEVLVQVTKEPIASKGCRVTTWVSLAGRYCVLLPNEDQVGISQRIGSTEERRRLKDEFRKLLPKGFGLVARTAAGSQDPKGLQKDLKELVAKWYEIQKQAKRVKAPGLVYAEPSQVFNVLRDVAAYGIDRVTVDDRDLLKEIQKHLGGIDPGWRRKIQPHTGDQPAFLEQGLEKQISQAMRGQIWLKSGGRIVIDQTEALTVIDVNSGRYVGKRAAEDTVYKVNLEAAAEIARQLRLRDIGGIIVIDFIDMESRQRRAKVLEELKRAIAEDRSRPEVHEFSQLGLVEMSRKRTKPSLWHTSSETCSACQGTGRTFHPSALAGRVVRGLLAARKQLKGRQLDLVTHPDLADYIEETVPEAFAKLTRDLGCKIFLEEDESLPLSRFKVRDRRNGAEVDLGDFSIDSGQDLEYN